MTVSVMISTMNNLKPLFFKKNKGHTIVVNQTESLGNLHDLENCILVEINDKGLAKSRNIALEKTKTDFALISDDDVAYVENYDLIVEKYFKILPDADILTFQIHDNNGRPYKNYKNKIFKHNKISILKVSSVEIAINIRSIKNNDIKFDEKFGLGAQFKCGEENIFLLDCLDKGLIAYYINIPLVIHPLESSGKNIDYNYFYARGAVFFRMYGMMVAFLFYCYFSFFKSVNKSSFFSNLIIMIKGANMYKKGIK